MNFLAQKLWFFTLKLQNKAKQHVFPTISVRFYGFSDLLKLSNRESWTV